MTHPDYRALCAELSDAYLRALEHINNGAWLGYEPSDDPLIIRTSTALAQPEPVGLTDEEIVELMPQQMHEDLAASAVNASATPRNWPRPWPPGLSWYMSWYLPDRSW